MKTILVRVLIVLCLLPLNTLAQKPADLKVMEDNIRAELGFLASDAMQGRGSGTIFERIAAEYIGTQFRQFGLEAAGDADSSGAKTFVQRVPMETSKFSAPPVLSAGDQKWTFGRDFLATFLRAPKFSGELQVIEADGVPAKGAVVLVKLPESATQQQRQDITRKARAAQVSGLVLLETDTGRRTREGGQAPPTLGTRIKGETGTDSGFAAISVSKAMFDQLAAMPAGSKVEFGGPVETTETGATWNAIGMLKGSDPKLSAEVIMLSAHLDHLGVNESLPGDKIFNGADDDASGCVAVLELARNLAAGKRPKRTVYFICFGSEERGGHGARYFINNSPVPLTQIVADVTFEMLGRPDAKVAPNTLWLTGYERSTLGPELTKQGALLVQDPHPEQNFFQRSDNYTLALRGVVAHTVSSFGLHTDYHQASDEVSKVDFPFMTRSIHSMIKPITWLANNPFKPSWLPGQSPAR